MYITAWVSKLYETVASSYVCQQVHRHISFSNNEAPQRIAIAIASLHVVNLQARPSNTVTVQ